MSVRLKRLGADHENIARAFAEHPAIRVIETEGDPPERYKVEFRLKGIVIQDGKVMPKDVHLAEIYLPLGYPRQAPQCRMLSPIYHPNIAPHAICIGDHWSAGESLSALLARIGEMLAYQSYNTKSPLNGEAARWASENLNRLPLDPVSMLIDEAPPDPTAAETAPRPVRPAPAPAPVARPEAPAREEQPGLACHSCGSHLRYNPALVGKKIRCPKCQTVQLYPGT